MNSDTAISVRNLGKSYVIQHQNGPTYKTLRESLLGAGKKFLSRNKEAQSSTEIFWALQDISFDVKRGEVLGVIGRNGAGKSTLLKILSRITEPTTGYADINGRVGSLLEVGTGFNPELTGRENIYLNGTILGMRRRQITKIFDQIVEFAGIGKFFKIRVVAAIPTVFFL
jgi:lipopolysaccharide transport system ATP-binding protein